MDQATDSDQAINFVTDRLSKRCCDRIYKLVLCDYRLNDAQTMCRQIQALTKLRYQIKNKPKGEIDYKSDSNGSQSLPSNSQLIIDSYSNDSVKLSSLFLKNPKKHLCTIVGVVDKFQVQDQIHSISDTGQQFLTRSAWRKGYHALIPKPFGTESLNELLDYY